MQGVESSHVIIVIISSATTGIGYRGPVPPLVLFATPYSRTIIIISLALHSV